MFRHTGKSRTFIHNLKLASLLSIVAGIVNVSGFFAVKELTTNVTGHFAFFAESIFNKHTTEALHYLAFIFSFFAGAFVSSLLVEGISRINLRLSNMIPILLESLILTSIALATNNFIQLHAVLMACSLLFAMGLQNALVTQISNSVVRTTHLTGLFTDLGIELSQLFYFRSSNQSIRLKSSIKLRLTIIVCFFCGCILGGFLYRYFQLYSLMAATFLLLAGLTYDIIKFKFVILKRKYWH
jgi:uncharacterized membrane protein YoaK (UPF0700 family)